MKIEFNEYQAEALIRMNPPELHVIVKRLQLALKKFREKKLRQQRYFAKILIEMGARPSEAAMEVLGYRLLTATEFRTFERWADEHSEEEWRSRGHNPLVTHPVIRYRWFINAKNRAAKEVKQQ